MWCVCVRRQETHHKKESPIGKENVLGRPLYVTLFVTAIRSHRLDKKKQETIHCSPYMHLQRQGMHLRWTRKGKQRTCTFKFVHFHSTLCRIYCLGRARVARKKWARALASRLARRPFSETTVFQSKRNYIQLRRCDALRCCLSDVLTQNFLFLSQFCLVCLFIYEILILLLYFV